MEANIRQIFRKVSHLGLKTFSLILISILIIFCDYKLHLLGFVRTAISTILAPIQYVANAPSAVFNFSNSFLTKQKQLLQDNAKLTAQHLLFQVQLQKLAYLEKDNDQLRALLEISKRVGGKVLSAQILEIPDADSGGQKIIIDRGSNDGVHVGQPVLDAYGVLGQIISISPFTSTVLLVTDAKSAIPVIDVRNGIRFIVSGVGEAENLEMINVSPTSDVKAGDLLVTSGVGFKLPEGYPVGVIKSVARVASARFLKVLVTPRAVINGSKYVLLVWPDSLARLRQRAK